MLLPVPCGGIPDTAGRVQERGFTLFWLTLALAMGIKILMLIGFAVPFLQVAHRRHARFFMSALVGLTALWWAVYELVYYALLSAHAVDRSNLVLLRGYAFSAALCSLLEEFFSTRDEAKTMQPALMALYGIFLLSTLGCLVLGCFGIV